jgi:phytoene dehydrogenase-like protein
MSLVPPEHLTPEFVHNIQHIKMRGVTARVHLLMDQQPVSDSETLVLAPSLNYLERAYDAAKYGQVSEHPYLEITARNQVLSVHVQFAPYHLRGSVWDAAARQRLEALVLMRLEEQMPGLSLKIKDKISITPLDLEKTYALSEGDINHGQLMLDQFLFMRPLPGWSNHITPLDGLYLCGSGIHGGGGISGIPGRNAARQVLKTGW